MHLKNPGFCRENSKENAPLWLWNATMLPKPVGFTTEKVDGINYTSTPGCSSIVSFMETICFNQILSLGFFGGKKKNKTHIFIMEMQIGSLPKGSGRLSNRSPMPGCLACRPPTTCLRVMIFEIHVSATPKKNMKKHLKSEKVD